MEWMDKLSEPKTNLPSHCDRLKTPGIDVSTGSLGQGLSIGAGLAQGFKLLNKTNRVYAILGDGECEEGQIWEAAQYAVHYNLGNLIAFVDWNKKQVDGELTKILNPLDLRSKFAVFGWYALQANGSNTAEILSAIRKAQSEQGNKPAAIILDGIKGSGVPEFEEMEFNHHFAFEPDLINRVIDTLEKKLAAL
jgi:transketolase